MFHVAVASSSWTDILHLRPRLLRHLLPTRVPEIFVQGGVYTGQLTQYLKLWRRSYKGDSCVPNRDISDAKIKKNKKRKEVQYKG